MAATTLNDAEYCAAAGRPDAHDSMRDVSGVEDAAERRGFGEGIRSRVWATLWASSACLLSSLQLPTRVARSADESVALDGAIE
jgi:hypothetical protein